MSKSSKLIRTGPCNNVLYNCAINILNEVTGQKWGYVQSKVKISYITCELFGVKFATKGKSANKKVDYYITTRTSTKDWENVLKFELYRALAKYIEAKNITITDELRRKLSCTSRCGITVDECDVDLKNCHEVNRYNETFVHAKTNWITAELSNIPTNLPRILTREDFM